VIYMSHLKGPISIILKDLKLQSYIFTAITLVLVIIYNGIGYYGGPDNFYPFISGPIYGILLFLPFFMFGDALKSTIGLGGTRTNYLTSLIISYLVFIVSLMIVHNVLFQLSELITDNTKSTTHIFHFARLFGASNAISYFWVDVLIGIFLVGTGTIVSAALYRFGYIWMLGIALSISILGFLWFTLGDISGILKWTLENMYLSLHLLGGLGVVCIVLTYPLIKQVTLKF
jgi:ABC-2 type transport system permease protein